jgi:hypothetical protein
LYKLSVLETLGDSILADCLNLVSSETKMRFSTTLRALLALIDENIGVNVLKSTSIVVKRLWSMSVFIYACSLLGPLLEKKGTKKK